MDFRGLLLREGSGGGNERTEEETEGVKGGEKSVEKRKGGEEGRRGPPIEISGYATDCAALK